MYDARIRDDWQHTASICAWLANVFRDSRLPPIPYEKIYPFSDRAAEAAIDDEPAAGRDSLDIDTARRLWLKLHGDDASR